MNRRIGIAAALTAALAAPLLASAPASAGAGVGCTSGTCSVALSTLIKVRGDTLRNGGMRSPDNYVPPCEWNPIGDQTSGSKAIIQEWQPDPPTAYGVDKSYRQAKQLLKNPQQGTWYILPVNPKASAAGRAECLRLPLYYFAVAGTTPPVPPIPPRQIALYAFKRMQIPLPQISVSPQDKGYVNLGTYVWATTTSPSGLQHAARVIATIQATNQTVSVWAQVTNFHVSMTGHGVAYGNDGGCTLQGSKYPVNAAPANAGAGTPPDCGVLWQGPDANALVRVTLTWRITWANYVLTSPNGGRFLRTAHTTATTQVPVSEIQSINGG